MEPSAALAGLAGIRQAIADDETSQLSRASHLWRGLAFKSEIRFISAVNALATGEHLKIKIAALLAFSFPYFTTAQNTTSPIQVETLIQSTSSWDGTPYKAYPSGQPQITVLKFTIAPHTTMKWHSHPLPNAAYILSGDLTIEKQNGTKQHFVAGQAVTETVDSIHRGVTGADPAVLIVFYPGTPGLPLSNSDPK